MKWMNFIHLKAEITDLCNEINILENKSLEMFMNF